MRTRCRLLLTSLAILLSSLVARGAPEAGPDAAEPANPAAEVERLLHRLGSADAAEHRIAAVRLKNLPAADVPSVENAARRQDLDADSRAAIDAALPTLK